MNRRKLSSILQLSMLVCAGAAAWGAPTPARAALIPPAESEPMRIRVRLAEAVPTVQIRGFDLKIFEAGGDVAGADRKLASAPERVSEWEIRCQDGRIRAIATKGAETLDLKAPVFIRTPAGFLSYRGRPYREELRIHSVGSFCEVVNEVSLEKYLDGLVNSEFNAKWSQEAIGAQVVAARTYAYHQMLQARKAGEHFDVDATVRDQVYDGSVREDFRSSRVVERTRGLVLTVPGPQGAQPIKAFYHSTCAGRTELPEHVWGMSVPGFKRSVSCPYCIHSPAINWSTELGLKDIEVALRRGAAAEGAGPGWPKNWGKILHEGHLLDVRVLYWDPEGRAGQVATQWSGGAGNGSAWTAELRLTGARFRDWLGASRLKSAAFMMVSLNAPNGEIRYRLTGRGNGHGVGMCQWGAKVMGEKGFNMAGILKHYYPDATLRKVW